VTLPGADELFRATSSAVVPSERSEADDSIDTDDATAADHPTTVTPLRSRPMSRNRSRHPSGREKHEEKITVYVSPTELVDLEHARLTLRADHGLAADRGRIVREAVAVVIADLEAKGADSILVRRLRDR
jgi:hypothetical protein